MRTFLPVLALLAVLLATTATPVAEPHPADVVWGIPGQNSSSSMPIGNGDLGANVWVDPDGDLVFYISKTDAFSENCRLLKLGRVRVTLDPPLLQEGGPFLHRLNLRDGTIDIDAGDAEHAASVRFWIDANHPVVQVDVESTKPRHVRVALEPWRTERRQLAGQEAHSAYGLHGTGGPAIFVEPDTVLADQPNRIAWYHRNERSIWKANLELQALGDLVKSEHDPLLHRTFGGLIRGDGLMRDSDTRLKSAEPRGQWSVVIHCLTEQTDTPEQWLAALQHQADEATALDHTKRLAAHQAWWAAFWDRSWIRLSGSVEAERVSRAYALQRWVQACSGLGAFPIKFNGSIFTVDASDRGNWDADYRRWGGPYWWQNTRLAYWPMLAAGDYDMMRPLFDTWLAALPLREHATRKYYGHDGAIFPETMYFWGTCTDANYGRDRRNKPDGLTDNLYIRRYWQGGIELVLLLLDYHDHTGDAAFRDETLLPLAVSVTAFFNQHWPRNEQGKIHFHPAQSLETWWDATNPMPEIVGLRAVLPRLLELPVDESQKAVWQDMLDDLPPVPTAEADGKRFLSAAERFASRHNSENPELYAVFPYRAYGLGKPDLDVALEAWGRRGVKRTGGWSQDAIQAALLGLTEEARRDVVKNFSSKHAGSRFPAFWGPNFDWIPDQDHGSVAMMALQTMLLQCDGRRITLLPAWPSDWDVDFKLHAPGQTTIEGMVRAGKVERLEVTPAERRDDVVVK